MKNGPTTLVFQEKQSTKSLKARAHHVNHDAGADQKWKKH